MRVRELVEVLQKFPHQDAQVVIGDGEKPDTWLIVAGVAERRIRVKDDDEDCAGPGTDPALEIV